MQTADYYSRINTSLLNLIPPQAGRVMEVGCGTGALARVLKERNPGLYAVGVERHAEAAAQARAVMDRVVTGDVEALANDRISEAGEPPFDVLIYGDVLEHLVDPWATLRRHVGLLREGGVVVASIPNLQYWKAAGLILTDGWKYQEQGILDRGHLRWFTRSGVLALVKDAGLGLECLIAVPGDHSGLDRYCDAMTALVRATAQDPATFRLLSGTLQFTLRARRPASGAPS